jgi:hypothetical protein
MRVLDQAVVPVRGSVDAAGDRVLVTDSAICVVDFATRSVRDLPDRSRALPAFDTQVITALEQLADGSVTPLELLTQVNRLLAGLGPVEAPKEARPSCVLAMYSDPHREVWRIGDCHVLVDGSPRERRPRRYDEAAASARAARLSSLLLMGYSVDELRQRDDGRRFIEPLLAEQWRFRNLDPPGEYGFGALDGGQLPPLSYIERIKVPESAREIVLATDGYPTAMSSLAESEALLSHLVDTDPLCIGPLRSTKGVTHDAVSFDDRAFVRIQIDLPM